jgi:hypothetical protein
MFCSFQIEARPYFRFPLPDLHADTGSQLTWRCEAKAIPLGVYIWYKNGEILQSVPGDFEVKRNTIKFQVSCIHFVILTRLSK